MHQDPFSFLQNLTHTTLSFQPSLDDGVALNRARLEALVQPAKTWRIRLQIQDSRSGGLAPGRSRTGTDGPFDVRQLYFEAGAEDGGAGWSWRLGRQTIFFSEERIFAERNWNNISPAWDGATASYERGRDRLDFFVAAQVENDPDDVDAALTGSRVAGFYGGLGSLLPNARLEPYWFFNDRPRLSGVVFDEGAGIHNFGARLSGLLSSRADYAAELTGQRGYARNLRQRGWSGYGELGLRPWDASWEPRLFAIFEYASGDADPDDGEIGVYDSGLGKRHSHLGAADAVGRSNLRTLETGLEASPASSLLLRCAYHRFLVASRADGVYRTNGLLAVAAPLSTSASRIGDEVDVIVEWSLRRDWIVEGGFGLFFPGPFLDQALDERVRRDIIYVSFEWSL